MLELEKSMEERVEELIIDFMNLVFGFGEETHLYWEEVLLPEVHVYYSYSLQELYKFQRNLPALYYALVEHLNLRVTEKVKKDESNNDANNKTNGSSKHQGQNRQDGKRGRTQQENKLTGLEPKEDNNFWKEFGKSLEPFGNP